MKNLLSICLLLLCSGSVMAAKQVKPGMLVCNPINGSKDNHSIGITVKWSTSKEGEHTLAFLDDDKYYKSAEKFIYEDEVWNSYCKRGLKKGDYHKNICRSTGYISFFNGRTLVKEGIEFACRNEKSLK